MSIYSTLTLTPDDAIKLIAEHMGIDLKDDRDQSETPINQLLSNILFELTSKNKYSDYHYNNYIVTEDVTQLDESPYAE